MSPSTASAATTSRLPPAPTSTIRAALSMGRLATRREKLGFAGRDTEQMSGEELRRLALATMAGQGWDQRLRDLVHLADTATINTLHDPDGFARSPPWPTATRYASGRRHSRDDALWGVGANVALKDAVRLCHALKAGKCRSASAATKRCMPMRPG